MLASLAMLGGRSGEALGVICYLGGKIENVNESLIRRIVVAVCEETQSMAGLAACWNLMLA